MSSTKDVLANHLSCFGAGDLVGVLSDYAQDAVMLTADGPLRGRGEIEPMFRAMIEEFAKPGATFTMKQQLVDGDHAFIVWTAETADNVYEFATDTFVVRDGKIVAQSYAAQIRAKG